MSTVLTAAHIQAENELHAEKLSNEGVKGMVIVLLQSNLHY